LPALLAIVLDGQGASTTRVRLERGAKVLSWAWEQSPGLAHFERHSTNFFLDLEHLIAHSFPATKKANLSDIVTIIHIYSAVTKPNKDHIPDKNLLKNCLQMQSRFIKYPIR
jgi:hypothetical protein